MGAPLPPVYALRTTEVWQAPAADSSRLFTLQAAGRSSKGLGGKMSRLDKVGLLFVRTSRWKCRWNMLLERLEVLVDQVFIGF
ncbi:unnamed protein product [Durusdinium trenchii]|uniref:Uncharacterized protein n=1 Tax=Durusdinium trenchii TaxID=1381693 RepID=A0ABP0KZM3_9DINO